MSKNRAKIVSVKAKCKKIPKCACNKIGKESILKKILIKPKK